MLKRHAFPLHRIYRIDTEEKLSRALNRTKILLKFSLTLYRTCGTCNGEEVLQTSGLYCVMERRFPTSGHLSAPCALIQTLAEPRRPQRFRREISWPHGHSHPALSGERKDSRANCPNGKACFQPPACTLPMERRFSKPPAICRADRPKTHIAVFYRCYAHLRKDSAISYTVLKGHRALNTRYVLLLLPNIALMQ